MKRLLLLHMYCAYFFLYSLLPLLAESCSPYNFSCGVYNLNIQYPFFTTSNPQCQGLHLIQCTNLVPLVRFHGETFVYPVWNISYTEKSIVIHDLKLSAYFRGSDCVFLYKFSAPIPRFNVSILTDSLNSSQQFFNCQQNTYEYSNDIFEDLYSLTPCKDYSLFYSSDTEDQSMDDLPSYCSTASDIWFDWKLSFGDSETDGGLSLLSVGFSRKWTPFPDCFSCKKIGLDCHNNSSSCGNIPSAKGYKGSKGRKIALGAIVSVTGLLLVCALCIFWYRRKLKRQPSSVLAQTTSFGPHYKKDLEPISFHCDAPIFSYEELVEATGGFDPSNELGDGGYGTVYKGLLRDGRIVAIKRLYETSYKRVEQFVNEVKILSLLRHPHLLTLYGCTSPTSPHLLLVYEYISNGTLAHHLHDPLLSKSLPISLRLSIAIETASALSYLHSKEVIHRDVKSHNILVDQNYKAKVADFGLSRLFPANATHVSTAPQGTPGYLDPEYHRFYQLTDKSDVYSYGVVLMEMIASRPAVDVGRKMPSEISLATMAVGMIQKGELDKLVDPGLMEYDCCDIGEVKRVVTRMAELAFRCLQMDREMRPSIKDVVEELREIEKEGSAPYKLLKSSSRRIPCSPNSVIDHKWPSQSTNPDTTSK